jgi:hypothetical protein
MTLDPGLAFIAALAAVSAAAVALRRPGGLRTMAGVVVEQGRPLVVRVPLALLAAAFLTQLLPTATLAALIGRESGLAGILVATALGGLVPGGPMVSFPLALVIWQTGAGEAQMVTFLAAWSIFAAHRILAYELPLMGAAFVALRLASSLLLPPLAGLLAMAMLALL